MNKIIKNLITVILVVAIFCTSTVQIFAAGQKQYISDLRISYGDTDAEARQWLLDNGYTPVKQNINQGSSDGLSKDKAVWMGYKTTTKVEDAITDIAMMDMKGGYSFSDYQTMLEKKYASFESLAKDEMVIINEFKQRYNEGSPLALNAYKALNCYIEDDSQKLVGDFLMDDNLPLDTLVKFVTQISQTTLDQFNTILSMGVSDYKTDSFLAKLSNLPDSEIEKIKTEDKYYDNAYKLLIGVENYGQKIREYLAAEENVTSEEIAENSDVAVGLLDYAVTYALLKSYKYGDSNLAELFSKKNISVRELYPLASVMTQAQIEAVAMVNFEALLHNAELNQEDDFKEADAVVESDSTIMPAPISAYFGVDRSMFSDSVAITDAAMREVANTGDTSPLYGNISSAAEIALQTTAAVSAVTGIALAAKLGKFQWMRNNTLSGVNSKLGQALNSFNSAKVLKSAKSFKTSCVKINATGFTNEAGAMTKISGLTKSQNLTYMRTVRLGAMGIAMYVALAVSLIIEAVFMILEVVNYYNPEYTKIPRIMLDRYSTEEEEKFVRYDGVLDQEAKMGDTNGYVGKQWNALYYTKDKTVGHPLEASVLPFKDKTIQDNNYKPIHYFGQEVPVDLNLHTFGNSPDIYVYFKQDRSVPLTASAISQPTISVIIGASGLVVGFLIATFIFKRKKKVPEASVTTTE